MGGVAARERPGRCRAAAARITHKSPTLRESAIYELCERLQPGIIQDVHIPYCMTDWGGCIIQVKKRNKIAEGCQRNFLAAIPACNQRLRVALPQSPDIDNYSIERINLLL